ncbi:MAG TPA: thymidine phosphorylase, partial [Candidatus Dojkabacteria bacterium]|nr:thymidine phosphorylase [Candidatus Dojkabacteria bacterium]
MALYLKAKKIDISSGDLYNILLNQVDADKDGIADGDTLTIGWNDNVINTIIHLTSTDIEPGFVGIYSDIWEKFEVENDSIVDIFLPEPSKSVDIIRKKMLGKKLTEEELQIIMKDMGSRRIGEIETAYFMSTFFNPGFDEEETLWMTKAMAETGDILSFKDIKGNGDLVVDKHSIGGVAGKAVTPVLVPIIAAFDLIIPNTSTRAITSPAGTSDILEVVMPVSLNEEEIISTVKKTNACMVWGGALDLAPADDVLIHVERVIHMESYQKLMVSIVAKKISMGITHIVIDIPYGRGTKVQNPEDVEPIKKGFE